MRRPPAFLYQVVNRQDSATKLSRLYGATVVLTSDDGATTLYKATIPASTGAQSRYIHTPCIETALDNGHDGKKSDVPSFDPTFMPFYLSLPSNMLLSSVHVSNVYYGSVDGSRRPKYTYIFTNMPTGQPTRRPSNQPSSQPSSLPTGQPTRDPTGQPSRQPTRQVRRCPALMPLSCVLTRCVC